MPEPKLDTIPSKGLPITRNKKKIAIGVNTEDIKTIKFPASVRLLVLVSLDT